MSCRPIADAPVAGATSDDPGLEWARLVDLEIEPTTAAMAAALDSVSDAVVMYREVRVLEEDGRVTDGFAVEHASGFCGAPTAPVERGVYIGPAKPSCEPLLKDVLRNQVSQRLPDVRSEEDGEEKWSEVTLRPLGADRLVCVWRDITEEVREQQNLSESLSALTDIANSTPETILRFNEEGVLAYAGETFIDLFGIAPNALGGSAWFDLVNPDDLSQLETALDECRSDAEIATASFRLAKIVGEDTWVEARVRTVTADDGGLMFQASLADITERKLDREELERAAHFDPLTGLYNRAGFLERLDGLISHDDAPEFTVLFCDLDGFKAVNDTYGHDAGDQVLVEVGQRIQSLLRATDFAGRLGGDEFVVILTAPSQHVSSIVQRLEASIAIPVDLGDVEVIVGTSTGTAHSADAATGEDLLKIADQHMYVNKRDRKRLSDAG